MPSGLLSWLLSTSSVPALSANAFLFSVPLIRLLQKAEVETKDKAPLSIDGVPQQIILATLNGKRNLPNAGRRRFDKAGKEGKRAEVKAMMATRAREAHVEQKAYEAGFLRKKRWNWKQVERELAKRQMSWAGLALLAAEVGLAIEIAAKAA